LYDKIKESSVRGKSNIERGSGEGLRKRQMKGIGIT